MHISDADYELFEDPIDMFSDPLDVDSSDIESFGADELYGSDDDAEIVSIPPRREEQHPTPQTDQLHSTGNELVRSIPYSYHF
jgi:hypothetical protein